MSRINHVSQLCIRLCLGWLLIGCAISLQGQQTSSAVVPPLVSFNGVLTDVTGKPLTNITGVTFLLYKEQQGGAPVWLETQNVQPDESGHYTVMLGSTTSTGLPSDIFVAGEAHWLAVQPQGQAEQARIMLLSVPYAIKAGDAQTVGGLPASAFVLAAAPNSVSANTATPSTSAQPLATGTTPVTTAGGTANLLAKFDATADITNSQIFDNGTNVGVGTATPAAKLDVKGTAAVRGLLTLPNIATATATTGYTSQPLKMMASAFNSGSATAVAQNFQLQAEPVGNDTSSTSGTLNLLHSTGTSKLAETGLKIGSSGQITFAAGQTFPGTGTGSGTVTSIATGLGLTGGPITSSGTLAIDPTVVPQLNLANVFTGNQTVNGNVSASGLVTGSAFNIGSNLFAFGSYASGNAFLGFAGNATTTGTFNTASGAGALYSNTTGGLNTASGSNALYNNTTGLFNTAVGAAALPSNTTGSYNTASGASALQSNTTGNANTANGYSALANNTGYSNTATGAYALTANTTGTNNTAAGYYALQSMTTGAANTAVGNGALYQTTTGGGDTASGAYALQANTTGSENTSVGYFALQYNTTGGNNTAVGYNAGPDSNSTALVNATAIGANAVVSESNALVLGGTGANAVSVGIGTATPGQTLDVVGNVRASGNFIGNGSQLTSLPAATTVNCTGCITNTQLGVNYAGSASHGGAATSALNALALNGLTASAFAAVGTANTFAASQTINGSVTISGTGNGISFPDGTSQTSAAGIVPSGFMILGTTSTAPPGYTLSPLTISPSNSIWAGAASMPYGAYGLAAAADTQGNIYAIGGYNSSSGTLATVEKYSPSSNTWTAVASLPYAVAGLAAAADTQGNIYAIGGYNSSGGYLATVEKYSPSSNTWTAVASLPYPAQNLAAAADTQGNIYAIGGGNMTTVLATVEKYSPSSNTWTAVASLPYPVLGLAAAADTQGNIYAIGGDSGSGTYLATVEKYSPSSNTWTAVASLPYPVLVAAAAGTQGNIYAIGGYNGSVYESTVEKFSGAPLYLFTKN